MTRRALFGRLAGFFAGLALFRARVSGRWPDPHPTKVADDLYSRQILGEYPKPTDPIDHLTGTVKETERRLLTEKQQHGKSRAKLRRLTSGTCAHCNRTFRNLQEHMEKEHPQHVHRVDVERGQAGRKLSPPGPKLK